MLGLEAIVLGKETFRIKKGLHKKFQSTDFWCVVDNGLLCTIVMTWMGKSAGNRSSMNIKFTLGLIQMNIYFLSAFFFFLLLCPFHLCLDSFCLLALIIITLTERAVFSQLVQCETMGTLFGGEGDGRPRGRPTPSAQTEGSAFWLVLAAGRARCAREFLTDAFEFPKRWTLRCCCRIFPRAQGAGRRHRTLPFLCTFSLKCHVWAAGQLFCRCYLLLLWVLCLRRKGQFLKERQQPASFPFSFSLAIILFQLGCFLWGIQTLEWQMFISGCLSHWAWALRVYMGAVNSSNSWQIFGERLQNVYVKYFLDVMVPRPGSGVLIVTALLDNSFRLLPGVSFKISIFTDWNIFLWEKA